ncbi:MAG: nitrous oxide reductase family maturation protein NosD, partial [Thermoanaerobaculia bacterium]|nr:nitrous oxide reductase family maturation protein NosD [Thermoanaerobaculia bacterium]
EENSGIAVEAGNATIEGNRLEEVLFGVYLRKAHGSRIVDNEIRGMDLDLPRRGDAIRIWYSNGVDVVGNRVESSRDVVLWYSEDLEISNNRVRDGRYGLHFMYCDDAEIRGNSLIDNSVGAFLMYSRRLRLINNFIAGNHGPSGYGIGLKDMDDALLENNLFIGNRVGAYLDNSPREITSHSTITHNLFAANDLGIRLMPNVRRADIVKNSFVENREQVAIAGGGGDPTANIWEANYWSDYRGFDLDGDGTGDIPYRAERLFESLADRHQQLRFFSYSPASRAIDFAARAFPLVRPQPKLIDLTPAMAAMIPTIDPGLTTSSSSLASVSLFLALTVLFLLAGPRWYYLRTRLALEVDGVPSAAGVTSTMPRTLEAAAQPALIEVDNLGKTFGSFHALQGLTFSIQPGQAVALWGDNGAGKTTALRALLGVVAFSGRVRIDGHDIASDGKAARRQIGFVPQETAFPDLKTRDIMELFARLHRAPEARIPVLLEKMGLDSEVDKPVQTLSGGRRQRLALAVALLGDPPLLLLDEPTANLDVHARLEFIALLRQLKSEGRTIVFSSHRPEEVRALADRVLHLETGRLLADRPARELFDEVLGLELEIFIPEAHRGRALKLLSDNGFDVRARRERLVVRTASKDKIAPLALLMKHEVAIDDFVLETEHVR